MPKEVCCEDHPSENAEDDFPDIAESNPAELEMLERSSELFEAGGNTVHLPLHFRCCSHTLSLICTADSKKCPDKKFRAASHSTFGKCSALWNAADRPKAAEIIFEHAER